MKGNILFFAAFMAIAGYGYSQKENAEVYRGFVRYVNAPTTGSITVLCSGFAKKKTAESTKDAFSGAFYALLFRGIPGSQYDLPMIPNENEKKGDPVVAALLEDGYMSFVTESSIEGKEKKVRRTDGVRGIMTTHRITINCDALRRHLEQNNVIRKFGI